ncbi:MAG: hypothetical protein LBH13_02630 [Cellulomonadaceae bacterium]|nr:hypothetical protein [Cellulomonadaceae bacterium]
MTLRARSAGSALLVFLAHPSFSCAWPAGPLFVPGFRRSAHSSNTSFVAQSHTAARHHTA